MKRSRYTLEHYPKRKKLESPEVVLLLDVNYESAQLKKRYTMARNSFRKLVKKKARPSLYIPVELRNDMDYVSKNLLRLQELCALLYEEGWDSYLCEFEYTRNMMKYFIENFEIDNEDTILEMATIGTPASLYFPPSMSTKLAEQIIRMNPLSYIYFPQELKRIESLAILSISLEVNDPASLLRDMLMSGLISNRRAICLQAITNDINLSKTIIDIIGLDEYCSQKIEYCQLFPIIKENAKRIQSIRKRDHSLISILDIASDRPKKLHTCSHHACLTKKVMHDFAKHNKCCAMGVLVVSPCEYAHIDSSLKSDPDIIAMQLANDHTEGLPVDLVTNELIQKTFPDGNVPYNVQIMMRHDKDFVMWLIRTNPRVIDYSTIHHAQCSHFINDPEVVNLLRSINTLDMIRLYNPYDQDLIEENMEREPLLFLYSEASRLKDKKKIIERLEKLPNNLSHDILLHIHSMYKGMSHELKSDREVILAFSKVCFIEPEINHLETDDKFCLELMHTNPDMTFFMNPAILSRIDVYQSPISSTRQVWTSIIDNADLFVKVCEVPGISVDDFPDPVHMKDPIVYSIVENCIKEKICHLYQDSLFSLEKRIEKGQDKKEIEDLIILLSTLGIAHHTTIQNSLTIDADFFCAQIGYSADLSENDYVRRMEYYYPGLL